MAIFLFVLKIIGIILLWILGIAVALLLMILIIPVSYNIKGQYDEEGSLLDARISYFFHIFSMRFKYDEELKITNCIFGIPIRINWRKWFLGQDKEEEEKERASGTKRRGKTGKEWLELLGDSNTKEAWHVCKKRFGRMIRKILPKKLRLDVTYGLNDPYYTGVGLAVYDIFYIYLDKKVNLYPVYDEQTIKVSGKCRGNIIAALLFWDLFAIMFDEHCIKFYKRLIERPIESAT